MNERANRRVYVFQMRDIVHLNARLDQYALSHLKGILNDAKADVVFLLLFRALAQQ